MISRFLVRASLVGLAALAAAALTGCFTSNTTDCSGGVVCPEGFVCTADGLGCTATACGNGITDPGEECDDGNQSNDDDCLRTCVLATCGDGFVDQQGPDTEDCDDDGQDTSTCDSDCTAIACGDGHHNAAAGEACDDGNNDNDDGCKGDCLSDESCGNNILDDHLPNNPSNDPDCLTAGMQNTNCAEVCDDGNNLEGDGCSPNCLSNEVCRNGILDPGEVCDDGNNIDNDGCRNDCAGGAGCGNGLIDVQDNEQCDNGLGAGVDSAECDGDCTVPICGDDRVNAPAGEECDPGVVGMPSTTCDVDCSNPACGDGVVNVLFVPAGGTLTENCDDGNTDPGDGCSALCRIESCGNGVTETINGEECDDANTDDLDGCRNNCQLPACGDGIASTSETCDTGGNTQTCNFDCTAPACGDGIINTNFTPPGGTGTESCDDGNTTPNDGCSPLCRIETCGNGTTESLNGEECDDGNMDDLDGCRNNCRLPACGDGVDSNSEVCDTGGNTTTCDFDCTLPVCGDDVVNLAAGEQCEDGNLISGDGCSSACLIEPFTMAAVVNGTGTGTVTSSPAGINCGSDCSEPYIPNTMVTLTATPAANSTFTGWSGGGCTGTGTCVVTMDDHKTVTATFTLNTLGVTRSGNGIGTVTSSPAGITCGATCTATYDTGTMVTLTATADSSSTFTGWSGGGCTGTGTCVVTLNTATTVDANFTLRTFDVTVSKSGTGTGTVQSVPAGVDCGATCTAGFTANTMVTLVATPSIDATFTGWSGSGCSGTGTCILTMDSAKAVTAQFTIVQYTLTVAKSGTGTVTSSPGGINCGGTCAFDYDSGTVVTLTALPGSNRYFVGWSGGGCSGTGTCVVTMDSAKSVTATFANNTLTVIRSGDGGGTVTSSPSGINCGGNCTQDYNVGTLVTLTASAGNGSRFAGWSGGGCSGTGTCVVTMNSATTVTADFVDLDTLTVSKTGSGTGTVTSSPAGISCGATCSADFDDSTMITLTAVAGANSVFTGWSGGGCSGTGTCVVTITTNTTVTANFDATFTLTAATSGSGTGSVTSSPGTINCPGTCTDDFQDGTVVTLTATPSGGSVFTGWSGDCAGTGSCMVTMDQARSVTATFTSTFTLTVNLAGGGTGTVTSSPVGIDCGLDCTEDYNDSTVVTLTATAAGGSVFTGWSGGGCSGTGTCDVTMSSAQSVTATFEQEFQLSVTIDAGGSGTGTVTSSPGSISCTSGTCNENFVDGTVVTLTAAADGGSAFVGWGGDCASAGTSLTCMVTVDQARSATATFDTTFALGVTIDAGGSGTGTVTSSPGSISCTSGTCNESFADGTVVTLTPAADAGSVFVAWAGDCTGNGACMVTMDQARNVTATFDALFTLTTATNGGAGTGTVASSPGSISCPGTCSDDFADGTMVTLTPTPDANMAFVAWTGDCTGNGACVVTMSAARSVTAQFEPTFNLTVTLTGSQTGTVTSSPGSINCTMGNSPCTEAFVTGAGVTLSAVADGGSTFVGWSGEGCSGTGTCMVTMDMARSVSADFSMP